MSSPCRFCDTDFIGTDGHLGGRYSADELVKQIKTVAPNLHSSLLPLIVLTGGEPLLQVDQPLLKTLQDGGFYVAIETNGTQSLRGRSPDWITCSPKTEPEKIKIERIDEIKLVYPIQNHLKAKPSDYMRELPKAQSYYLQPMDESHYETGAESTLNSVVEYVKLNPSWAVSIQTHKIMQIP